MQPNRSRPDRFDEPMSVFRVRPDWYEDYWLRLEQAPSNGRRRPLSNVLLRSILYGAIVSMLVYFGH
jgi:hypothetical protein